MICPALHRKNTKSALFLNVSAPWQLGVYDEAGLQRLDLILAEAAKNNVRVIFPLVNVWPDLGGMQWWVDQV